MGHRAIKYQEPAERRSGGNWEGQGGLASAVLLLHLLHLLSWSGHPSQVRQLISFLSPLHVVCRDTNKDTVVDEFTKVPRSSLAALQSTSLLAHEHKIYYFDHDRVSPITYLLALVDNKVLIN